MECEVRKRVKTCDRFIGINSGRMAESSQECVLQEEFLQGKLREKSHTEGEVNDR